MVREVNGEVGRAADKTHREININNRKEAMCCRSERKNTKTMENVVIILDDWKKKMMKQMTK